MALDTVFSGGDDGFLTSLAGDMEDLFSDDLLNFLDTDYGSLALAQASLACPLDATPPSFLATAAAVISAGSACASPAHSSGNSSPSNMCPASTPVGLPIQRCAGPPTAPKNRGPVRLVTTELPPAEVKILQEPKCSFPRIEENASPSASVHQSDDECDSDDSEDTGEYDGLDGSGISKKANKRKAPEVDWRAIADPSERRRQRRLAKNRVTAARSRERKKVQWADMEAKLSNLNNDNKRLKAMLEQLSRENTVLRGQLASTQGDGSGRMGRGSSQGTEPAALVFISILLLLCCSLPSDQAMLLGSAAPLLLLAQMLSSGADVQSLSDALLRFLSSLKMLLSRGSKRLGSSVHRLLYKRPHHMGRKALRDTYDWASSSSCLLLQPRIDVLSKVKVKDEPDYDVPFFPFLLGNGGC